MQKRQRLTEMPYSSGTGCGLSADRHRGCVPQTPQAHLRAACAEDTPLPVLVCKALADARHAETLATDGNPLQFGHWGPPECCLSADRHRSCVPQTPQAHLRAVCAEDTTPPAPVCTVLADARHVHAEIQATDGNPLQFSHWVPFECR